MLGAQVLASSTDQSVTISVCLIFFTFPFEYLLNMLIILWLVQNEYWIRMRGFQAREQIYFPEDDFHLLQCCIAGSSSSNRKTNISNSLLQFLVFPSRLEGEKVGKVLYPLSPMFHRLGSLVLHDCTACDSYFYSCPGRHLITWSHSCSL